MSRSPSDDEPGPRVVRLRRGLDLRIPGAPEGLVERPAPVRQVALLGDDHPGLRPALAVEPGERVRLGQPLFSDRERPAIHWVAPAAGVVRRIELTTSRQLRVLEIAVEGDGAVEFPRHGEAAIRALGSEGVARTLLEAGLWIALRTRPFGRIPDPATRPAALFVRAIDTEPLAAPAAPRIRERAEDFRTGLIALAQLCEAPPFVCSAAGDDLPLAGLRDVRPVEFAGPHPAGLVGTHIHHLAPVGQDRTAWYVGHQDVIAIGALLRHGRFDPERVVALGGPAVRRPRCLRTRLGAATEALVQGELRPGPSRVISGSPLSGRQAAGDQAFLGRYHEQVCALFESRETPGTRSALARIASRWRAPLGRRRRFTTALHGRRGPMLPIERFERIAPLDLHVAALLRALAVGDAEQAATLGALELEEEDLALASYVCPGKLDYGRLLREGLDALEARG